MLSYYKSIFFLINVFKTFSLQSLYYIFNLGNYNFLDNLAYELTRCNILFVKLYQSLAGNTEVFNDKWISVFKKYINNVPYTTQNNDYKIIKQLGFETHDTKLINSGTIAVVYKTIYKNKDVIVKIKRNNLFLQEEIEKLELICNIISKFPYIKHLNLNNIINFNKESILNQLDFSKEVSNMKTMYKIHSRINYVKIPFVYEEFSNINKDVIVMEYLHGKTIYDIDANDKKEYANLFAQFGIKSLLFDGIYHADAHPGNIIFMKNNDQLVLGIIDFGLVNHLTKEEQNQYYLFYKHLDNKFELAKHIFNNLCETKKSITNENLEKLLYELREIVNIFNKKMTINEIYKINKILARYNSKLKDFFYKLLLGLSTCEGTMIYLTNTQENLKLLHEVYKKMTKNLILN